MRLPRQRAGAVPASAATPATATERVYQGICSAVLERRLEPGAWLREEELAVGFGVSRTVVRQALQRLAQDQVAGLEHNRGARVPLPMRADAAHVFEARRVVECEIARRPRGSGPAARPGRRPRIEAYAAISRAAPIPPAVAVRRADCGPGGASRRAAITRPGFGCCRCRCRCAAWRRAWRFSGRASGDPHPGFDWRSRRGFAG